MPLIGRHQIAAPVEDFPGIEQTTVAGSDVVDSLSADFSQNRSLTTRQTASNSLSRSSEPIGRGDAGLSTEVDFKGSGTATTAPDYGGLLESCLLKEVTVYELAFDASQTLVAVRVGDIITNAASTSVPGTQAAVVVQDTALGADSVRVVQIVGTGFSTSEAVVRRRGTDDTTKLPVDTSVGSTDEATPTGSTVGVAWRPHSQHEITFEISGAWSASDPAEGENIQVTSGGEVVAEVMHISTSGTTVTAEPLWTEDTSTGIPASATLASTSGKTATVSGTPAVAQTQGKRRTVRSNRDRLVRSIIGAAGTYSLTSDAGGTARFSFEFTGKAATPTDAAHVTGATVASTVPPRLTGENGEIRVDGIGIPVKSFSHEVGNNVVLSANANRDEGDAYAVITARDPGLSFQVDQLGVGGFDWWDRHKNSRHLQVGIKSGTAAGNTLVFCATKGQIESVSDDDSDGIAAHTLQLRLRKYDASEGDNEFIIAHM